MINHKIQTSTGIQKKALTPMKAIRYKCLECSNWSFKEIQLCPIKTCALYPYRLGKKDERDTSNKSSTS